MATPTYIGSSAIGVPSIGLTSTETGIMVSDFSVTHENPSVPFLDQYGGRIGFAVNHDAALTYSLTGDVSSASAGVNVASFTAAATIANEEYFASASSTYNGLDYSSSDTFLTGASGSQSRGSARTVTLDYLRPRGFVVST